MAGAGAGTAAGEEAAPPADGGGDAKPQVTPAEVLAMGKYLGVRLEVRALNPPPPPHRPAPAFVHPPSARFPPPSGHMHGFSSDTAARLDAGAAQGPAAGLTCPG